MTAHQVADVGVERIVAPEDCGKPLREAGGPVAWRPRAMVAAGPGAGEGSSRERRLGTAPWAPAGDALDPMAELGGFAAEEEHLALAVEIGKGVGDDDPVRGENRGDLVGPALEEVRRTDDERAPDRPHPAGLEAEAAELGRGVRKVERVEGGGDRQRHRALAGADLG